MKDSDLLNDLYYNKHNYDGITNLYKKAKKINVNITKDFVKEWLDLQSSHQQTAVKVGKKDYLPIYSETPYSFQIDLTFFPRYATRNKNFSVLFTAINVNSRYVFAYKSKDKSMTTILEFMEKMEQHTPINSITCDEGTEFNNKKFISFCNSNNITLYFVKGDSHKLGIINRFHRTLKDKLSKYFIATNSVNWVDVFDKIVNNYNHTINRGIGIEPAKVNTMIEKYIINEKREKTEKIKDKIGEMIEVGDFVRLKRDKKLFGDKMLSKYGDSVYEVTRIKNNSLELIDNHDNLIKVKKSEVLKVKQAGLILPESSVIEKANNEHSTEMQIKRHGVNPMNILSKPRRLFSVI
jgi:hypothetical protein